MDFAVDSVMDWGCQRASFLAGWTGACAVLGFFFLLPFWGAWGRGGRSDPLAPLTGVGIFVAVMTCAAVAMLPLSVVLYGCIGLALGRAVFLMVRGAPMPVDGRYVLFAGLQVFVLTIIHLAGLAGWDDFSHWSLNALYLWRHDALPAAAGDGPIYSVWAAYPYAMPFLTWAVSRLAGAFMVQGGAMVAWMLLVLFAYALACGGYRTPRIRGAQSFWRQAALLTIALLFVTLGNPGFNASFSIMGGSDTPTMVALGFVGLIAVRLFDAIVARRAFGALLFSFGAAFALLLLLRQMNVVFLLPLGGVFLLWGLRAGCGRSALFSFLAAIVPALILRALWEHYTGHVMQQTGFRVLPFDLWRWDSFGSVLSAMGIEMARKWGLYLLLALVTFGGGWQAWRKPAGPRTLAWALAGGTAGFYILFLMAAYLGAASFSRLEVERAASFYRYSSHLSLLALVPVWSYVITWVRRRAPFVLGPAGALALIVAFGVVLLAKPVWVVAPARPSLCESRAIGADIAQNLSPSDRVAIVDWDGNGFFGYIVQYELALDDMKTGKAARIVHAVSQLSYHQLPFDILTRDLGHLAARQDVDAIYVTYTSDERVQGALMDAFPALMGAFHPPGVLLFHESGTFRPKRAPTLNGT